MQLSLRARLFKRVGTVPTGAVDAPSANAGQRWRRRPVDARILDSHVTPEGLGQSPRLHAPQNAWIVESGTVEISLS